MIKTALILPMGKVISARRSSACVASLGVSSSHNNDAHDLPSPSPSTSPSSLHFGRTGRWVARCATAPIADMCTLWSTFACRSTAIESPIPREASLEARSIVIKATVFAFGVLPHPTFLCPRSLPSACCGLWRGWRPTLQEHLSRRARKTRWQHFALCCWDLRLCQRHLLELPSPILNGLHSMHRCEQHSVPRLSYFDTSAWSSKDYSSADTR